MLALEVLSLQRDMLLNLIHQLFKKLKKMILKQELKIIKKKFQMPQVLMMKLKKKLKLIKNQPRMLKKLRMILHLKIPMKRISKSGN